MAEMSHHGSCHCGAVKYRVNLDLEKPVMECNCSICSRQGTQLAFVTPDKFTLEHGEDQQTEYKFNKHVISHLFCKTCGVKSFARGVGPQGPMVAINVRCLDGYDPTRLSVKQFDGKNM
jgi:hypothetical protein